MSTMSAAQGKNSIAEQLAFAKEQLKNSDSAATDSRLLMCQVLQCNTVYLMTWPEKPVSYTHLTLPTIYSV